jgi:hypothetical protein
MQVRLTIVIEAPCAAVKTRAFTDGRRIALSNEPGGPA